MFKLKPKGWSGSPRDSEGSEHQRSLLAASLQSQAQELMSANLYDSAITMLCSVVMLAPSRVSAVHKIGQCLEAVGALEEASSCYRGRLPDSINQKYLAANTIEPLVQPVSMCSRLSVHSGFKEEKIELSKPIRNEIQKSYSQFNYKHTFAREAFTTVAQDGLVWFDRVNVMALDCERNLIKPHMKGNEIACYHAIKTATPVKLNGTACFLDGRSSSIYYHWMLDILPKLGVLQCAGVSLEEIDYFIVSATSKFQLETLKACGVRKDQLVYSDTSSLYQADSMIVPLLKNDQGDKIYHGLGVGLSSSVPKFLQQTMLSGDVQKSSNESTPVRLYISRSTRGSRNIANEPEIEKALHARGFETVEFEKLTVHEQAELMSRADIVVGVHGAGFTNLSFCKPGTQVIEIFGDYVVPCYWALSAVAGLRYAQFMACSVAADVAADNPGERVTQLRDMEIDINAAEFIDYLDATLDEATAAA